MKPPVCAVCGRRFNPFRTLPIGRGGVVRFADVASLPKGATGHPPGTEWFCGRHLRRARALRLQPLAKALSVLARRRRIPFLWPILALAILLGTVTAWNTIGRVDLAGVDSGYVGRFFEGELDDRRFGSGGAALIGDWLETRTNPVRNPLRILWHQLWYNARTKGYEVALWLEPASGNLSLRQFALYQSGPTVFLRFEPSGKNRVLDADFSARELARALEPHFVGDPSALRPEAP